MLFSTYLNLKKKLIWAYVAHISEAVTKIICSWKRKLKSAMFWRNISSSWKNIWDESNHKLRNANPHTCPKDTISLWTLKSQQVQSQYILILNEGYAFFIPLMFAMSLTLMVLSEGFLILLELELWPLSPNKVEWRWITKIPLFSSLCPLTLSKTEGCMCQNSQGAVSHMPFFFQKL